MNLHPTYFRFCCKTLRRFLAQKSLFIAANRNSFHQTSQNTSKNPTFLNKSRMYDRVPSEEKKDIQISFTAQRLLQLQNQNDQKLTNTGIDSTTSNMFGSNLKVIASEISKAESIIENVATEEHDINFTNSQEDPLEFVTLPDEMDRDSRKKHVSQLLGTEDPSVKTSTVPCTGCGAQLQCNNRTLPGFMASEYFRLLTAEELKVSICQRCYLMCQRDVFTEVSTTPEEYADMISKIKHTRSIVVMVVDLMDLSGSIVPHLSEYIGYKHPIVVVGNKADLLAPDSSNYLQEVEKKMKKACIDSGLRTVRKCLLVSAKTGFGIERLINNLFSFYKQRVDVYIVGTANSGKSSLFNMLLGSDYCKHTARDLIQRATVSVWPGTTLNMLKFPIMRPSYRTVLLRQKRLKQKTAQLKEESRLRAERQLNTRNRSWELQEKVEMTDVRTQTQLFEDESGASWGQDIVSYKGRKDGGFGSVTTKKETTPFEDESYSDSYWMYDTPGIINPDQVLNMLTPEECSLLVPGAIIVPRTAVLHQNQTMFVSGLARVDFLQGEGPVFVAIHSSEDLPVYIQPSEEADDFYETNIGTDVLGVPKGDKERIQTLPSLQGEKFVIQGVGTLTAAADIQLSSVGWVSIASRPNTEVQLKAFTPGGKGLHVRQPSLLPDFSRFRGKRIGGTQFYRTKLPGSAMVGKTLEPPTDKE